MVSAAAIACAGHIRLGPESVLACIECGHPTDDRCLTCAKAHADKDPRRDGEVVDVLAIAAAAVDKSAVCPCCTGVHDLSHGEFLLTIVEDADEEILQ